MFEAPSGKTYVTVRPANCLAHLSTRFVAAALQSRWLSTAFARSSRRAGRRGVRLPSPMRRRGLLRQPRPTAARRPDRVRIRTALVQGRAGPAEAAGCRAQRNARRNLGSVASNACASTCAVAFDLVAPSGKTYSTVPVAACLAHLSTTFAVRGRIREGCPRSIHEPTRNPCGSATRLLERPVGRRRRAPAGRRRTDGARLDRRRFVGVEDAGRARSAASPCAGRRGSRRRGDADRRTLRRATIVDGSQGAPQTWCDAVGGHARCRGASRRPRGGASAGLPPSRARDG